MDTVLAAWSSTVQFLQGIRSIIATTTSQYNLIPNSVFSNCPVDDSSEADCTAFDYSSDIYSKVYQIPFVDTLVYFFQNTLTETWRSFLMLPNPPPPWVIQLALVVAVAGVGWWKMTAPFSSTGSMAGMLKRRIKAFKDVNGTDPLDVNPKRRRRKADIWYPGGLYNMGNTCFMNSVIQSLVSMPRLAKYLEQRIEAYYVDDHSLPELHVTDALFDLCLALNDASPVRKILKPRGLVDALAGSHGNHNHLLGYQQQDAHELFQFLSSLLTKEELPIVPSAISSFADIGSLRNSFNHAEVPSDFVKSPLRHDVFDNLSLTVASIPSCLLEKLIENYIQIESIHGYICDCCSLFATAKKLQQDLVRLEATLESTENPLSGQSTPSAKVASCGLPAADSVRSTPSPTSGKKKKKKPEKSAKGTPLPNASTSSQGGSTPPVKLLPVAVPAVTASGAPLAGMHTLLVTARVEQLRRDLLFVTEAIREQKYDITLPLTIKKVKIASPVSTKQISIVFPPPCLCLHMQRSVYLPSGHLVKNNSRIVFRDVLDLNDMVGMPSRSSGSLAHTLSTLGQAARAGLDAARMEAYEEDTDSLSLSTVSSDLEVSGVKEAMDDHKAVPATFVFNREEGLHLDSHGHSERLGHRSGFKLGVEDPPASMSMEETTDHGIGNAGSSVQWRSSLGRLQPALTDMMEDAIPRHVSHVNDSMHPQSEDGLGQVDASYQSRPFVYRLRAAILHYGSHDSGHFVTYRKFKMPSCVEDDEGVATEVWFRISDDRVDLVSDVETEVFGHGSQYAYMLYYER
ncbi:hypothetical protein BSLG_000936 [Batrachochytrium salamandrivorans]|nr:hypothetical protein BSLG_002492 [Batrachochytrium salamandrivorans]KAJ1345423.1 hypothetical protein BSLG_000936 [Batrachochytrium salamandrivorans]